MTNQKDETYDSILVVVNQLTKKVNQERVKIKIDASCFMEVIIDLVMRRHGLLDYIFSDYGSVLT